MCVKFRNSKTKTGINALVMHFQMDIFLCRIGRWIYFHTCEAIIDLLVSCLLHFVLLMLECSTNIAHHLFEPLTNNKLLLRWLKYARKCHKCTLFSVYSTIACDFMKFRIKECNCNPSIHREGFQIPERASPASYCLCCHGSFCHCRALYSQRLSTDR